jgi:methylated-DNA-[protein]-cysteine S-methyltransferase
MKNVNRIYSIDNQVEVQMKIEKIKSTLIKSPFGPIALIWSNFNGYPKIVRILLSNPDSSAEDQLSRIYPNSQNSSWEIEDTTTDIKAFLKGEDIIFSLDSLALEMCSPFQKAVLCADHQIPRGSISTYQLIARHIGKEKGARAVGNALANNPFPIIIPCHRVIRSDETTGGFRGGPTMKKSLLKAEGISFDHKGRIISPKYHYK